MQKFEKLMIPLTIVLLIFLGWAFFSNSYTSPATNQAKGNTQVFSTKSGDMGAVTIEVTPLSSSNFEIILSTHSVDLDFDLKEIVTLVDNNGKEYQPVSWSGDRGGHHLNGELQFSTMDPQAKSVTLTIRDIEDEVLSLEWML